MATSAAKLTAASLTPGCFFNKASTAIAQLPQRIPSTIRMVWFCSFCAVLPLLVTISGLPENLLQFLSRPIPALAEAFHMFSDCSRVYLVGAIAPLAAGIAQNSSQLCIGESSAKFRHNALKTVASNLDLALQSVVHDSHWNSRIGYQPLTSSQWWKGTRHTLTVGLVASTALSTVNGFAVGFCGCCIAVGTGARRGFSAAIGICASGFGCLLNSGYR